MPERMSDLEAEARRDALHWRRRFETLYDAVDVFLAQKTADGYSSARRELRRVWEEAGS